MARHLFDRPKQALAVIAPSVPKADADTLLGSVRGERKRKVLGVPRTHGVEVASQDEDKNRQSGKTDCRKCQEGYKKVPSTIATATATVKNIPGAAKNLTVTPLRPPRAPSRLAAALGSPTGLTAKAQAQAHSNLALPNGSTDARRTAASVASSTIGQRRSPFDDVRTAAAISDDVAFSLASTSRLARATPWRAGMPPHGLHARISGHPVPAHEDDQPGLAATDVGRLIETMDQAMKGNPSARARLREIMDSLRELSQERRLSLLDAGIALNGGFVKQLALAAVYVARSRSEATQEPDGIYRTT